MSGESAATSKLARGAQSRATSTASVVTQSFPTMALPYVAAEETRSPHATGVEVAWEVDTLPLRRSKLFTHEVQSRVNEPSRRRGSHALLECQAAGLLANQGWLPLVLSIAEDLPKAELPISAVAAERHLGRLATDTIHSRQAA